MRLVLLPGLDGTGELFTPLLRFVPSQLQPKVIRYSCSKLHGYTELLSQIEAELGGDDDLVILAESFSGPLAIQFAARHPQRVCGVALCASFIRCPVPAAVAKVARVLARLSPPPMFARKLLLERGASAEVCNAAHAAVCKVDRRVMAHRLAEVCNVDASAELSKCQAPILYLAADDDALVGPGSLDEILAIYPRANVKQLNGPHMLLQTAPAQAWSQIAAFLASCGIE